MSPFFTRNSDGSVFMNAARSRMALPFVPLVLALALCGCAGAQSEPGVSPQTSTRPKLIYAGDAYFPPFEYKDAKGKAQGFNIQLVTMAAQEAGYDVEFRLGAWAQAVASLDEGRADLAAVGYSGERAERYDLLSPIWNMNMSLLFPPGRTTYPHGLDQLAGERVALLDRGLIHETLLRLPETKQPKFRLCADQFEAVQKLMAGEATLVAGNGLTLRHIAAQFGLADLVEVEVASTSYFLVARKGRSAELSRLVQALEKIRASPRMSAIVESTLTIAPPPVPLAEQWRKYGLVVFALVVLAGGAFVWSAMTLPPPLVIADSE